MSATTTTAPVAGSSTPSSTSVAKVENNTASTSKGGEDDAGKKKKTTKRRKVNHACLYCRRSHMTCDEGRPCQRCIKREIGHLCHDERRPKPAEKQQTPVAAAPVAPAPAVIPTVGLAGSYAPVTIYPAAPIPASAWPLTAPAAQPPFLYQPETFGNEFSVLTDFLETLDDGTFFTPPTTVVPSTLMSPATFSTTATTTASSIPTSTNTATSTPSLNAGQIVAAAAALQQQIQGQVQPQQPQDNSATIVPKTEEPASESGAAIILPAATKTEKFLLTAADQEPGSRDERLSRVIRAKYEAGLLKPYNYVKGYARLSKWMDSNVSQESKQQILQPLSVLRPKFRAVAQSLRDIDLVFIEEAFERMLLDYDRVFSAMAVPACLWRRTGEIYKGNREFCELVGLDGAMMRDGRVCIYELMAEESAVNYWEKYGHVAFDSSQKAVLTSCVLRYKPVLNLDSQTDSKDGILTTTTDKADDKPVVKTATEERFVNCCFSFTIRRDKWGIPSMIVGNFIAC
ncbi:hypothetical protein CC1G_09476 [Coprinopsis cinerea okayama7|uniref:Zn(2)-C6 fungal-type domain-containing protein n=1 Tax=Coprinopsis cinerea (strain Okayama-7 / 130 / ATCC MYA-4618 / FGSC 9003) TaxID=240176 RepID=A8PDG1_COPC7|nr:hypothetical protein CC1G_09476 [Coprinopsis cinerea okayama7\|eukprot:XP_001840592.2 hypothetical protein CC1G_09476 [Coprinopsis cinerea okayama7\